MGYDTMDYDNMDYDNLSPEYKLYLREKMANRYIMRKLKDIMSEVT